MTAALPSGPFATADAIQTLKPRRRLYGTCARCGQTRPVFQPKESWGRVRGPLCSTDWQKYAEARANGNFVDFKDAFDNATDEQLHDLLGPEVTR